MSKRSRNDAEEARRNPPPPPPNIQRWREKMARIEEMNRPEREARQAAARERIRNMKMPSHPAPMTDEQKAHKNSGWWQRRY